jgi:hypothetical protein
MRKSFGVLVKSVASLILKLGGIKIFTKKEIDVSSGEVKIL